MIRSLPLIVLFVLAGCGSEPEQNRQPNYPASPPPIVATPVKADDALANPSPAMPTHNYEERRGETYYYIAAVSEEDEKRGIAVGNVHAYQYLGQNGSGEHILAILAESGAVSFRAKCRVDCRIIDLSTGGNIPFSTRSIIGAALQDAFNGELRVADWAIAETKRRTNPQARKSGSEADKRDDESLSSKGQAPGDRPQSVTTALPPDNIEGEGVPIGPEPVFVSNPIEQPIE